MAHLVIPWDFGFRFLRGEDFGEVVLKTSESQEKVLFLEWRDSICFIEEGTDLPDQFGRIEAAYVRFFYFSDRGLVFQGLDGFQVFIPQMSWCDFGVTESHFDSSVSQEFHEGREADAAR